MARSDYLFTSESVSEGHPDKVRDRISDEVVDLFFREGPKEGMSPWDIRAACETLCTTNRVVIAGETRGPKSVGAGAVEDVARQAIKDIAASTQPRFTRRSMRSLTAAELPEHADDATSQAGRATRGDPEAPAVGFRWRQGAD